MWHPHVGVSHGGFFFFVNRCSAFSKGAGPPRFYDRDQILWPLPSPSLSRVERRKRKLKSSSLDLRADQGRYWLAASLWYHFQFFFGGGREGSPLSQKCLFSPCFFMSNKKNRDLVQQLCTKRVSCSTSAVKTVWTFAKRLWTFFRQNFRQIMILGSSAFFK